MKSMCILMAELLDLNKVLLKDGEKECSYQMIQKVLF